MTRYSKRYKYQKSKSKFNHRLYISPNSYYDVVFATKYNLWLNQLAVFCCIQKKCVRTQKNWLHFVIRTKLPQDSTIGCTSVFGHVWEILAKILKIKIKFNYKLYFYSNTFNSCTQNKIQPMVESTRRFLSHTKICWDVKIFVRALLPV